MILEDSPDGFDPFCTPENEAKTASAIASLGLEDSRNSFQLIGHTSRQKIYQNFISLRVGSVENTLRFWVTA